MRSIGKTLQPVEFGFDDKTRPRWYPFLNSLLRKPKSRLKKMQTKTSCRDLCPEAKSRRVAIPDQISICMNSNRAHMYKSVSNDDVALGTKIIERSKW